MTALANEGSGLLYISKEKQPLSGLDGAHLSSTTQPAEHLPP